MECHWLSDKPLLMICFQEAQFDKTVAQAAVFV